MKINLNMFGALMLNQVGGHVDHADVVTIHQGGTAKRGMELLEKLTQPGGFGDGVGHGAVLCFSTGPGDGWLSFGRPRNQVVAKKDRIS